MSSTFVVSGQRFGTIPMQRARGFRGERRFGAQLAPPSLVAPVQSRALRIMRASPMRSGRMTIKTKIVAVKSNVSAAVADKVKFNDDDAFHVHFGAGRLGLGLVLPALQESGIPYAILQRPSKEWTELAFLSDTTVDLIINDKVVVPGGMHLFTSGNDSELPTIGDFPCDVDDAFCHESHLVLTNDKPSWSKLICAATSYSCAVGPSVHEWLGPLLRQVPKIEDASKRPILYACENDHAAVEKLSQQLEGRIRVIPCMVDRICATRTVDAKDCAVRVEAEAFSGSIIMLEAPGVEEWKIPLKGDLVYVPEDKEVADFFYKRKLLLVNGMHTALGFLTLVDHETSFMRLDRIESGEELEEVLMEDFIVEELRLLTLETATDTLKVEIKAWLVAQVLTLFSNFPLEVMLRANKTESVEELVELTYKFAEETLLRFNTMEDTTDRVLGGGVGNRFETRLLPTCKAVSDAKVMARFWTGNDINQLFLAKSGISMEDVSASCNNLMERATKFAQRDAALRLASKMHYSADRSILHTEFIGEVMDRDTVAVLFDFDGTLADTEVSAMEVAYWELVPYMLPQDLTNRFPRKTFMQENCGKAFEFMAEAVETDRREAGLAPMDTIRAAQSEDPNVIKVVDRARRRFGLKAFNEIRQDGEHTSMTIIEMQKRDTVLALDLLAAPCKNVEKMLSTLQALGVPFSIATTSGKPRVPVSVKSCGLEDYFPAERIHSGYSDFDPPRFKPDPAVYLKAAMAENALPKNCLAVEDSMSGVGAASNAEVGMIVGYVGATHIAESEEERQANILMSGGKSMNEQGADVVIANMADLKYLVQFFRRERKEGRKRPFNLSPKMFGSRMKGKMWVNEALASKRTASRIT